MKKVSKTNKRDITIQQPLDKWYKCLDKDGNTVEAPFNIFYLDWNKRDASWLSIMPENITYSTVIKWSGREIIVAGYSPDNAKIEEMWDTPGETYYTNISMLKSHLQKVIRRSNPNLALKTAYHLFKLDPQQLLRRLAIIMIEDCHMLEGLNVLVWLMAATSKGYVLCKSQVYWVFGLVYTLANLKDWDVPWPIYPLADDEWRKWGMSTLKLAEKSLIYTLQFRKSFGGMAGDKKMMDSFTKVWWERFKDPANPDNKYWLDRLYKPIPFVSPPEISLKLNEWVLPAIDFHCVPTMLSILVDKFDNLDLEHMKEAIWHFSSGYNNKKTDKPANNLAPDMKAKLFEVWTKIRPNVYSLASYYLEKDH